MAPPLVTYEVAKAKIGTLPTLAPRPNSTNIRDLRRAIDDALSGIPSNQSAEHGYAGLAAQPAIYALRTATAWQDAIDPGHHRTTAPTMDSAQARDEQVTFDTHKLIFDSEVNVRTALIDALNAAVPDKFKRMGGNQIGTRMYRPTDSPRDILQRLHDLYGKPTPAEKEANERSWMMGWDASQPIEDLYHRLEECFVIALSVGPAYTVAQMIDKAVIAIQKTHLYNQAILEWNGFAENQKTWAQLKEHFAEAYELQLGNNNNPYGHAANNLGEECEEDNLLGSITQSIQQIQLANNASQQASRDAISQLTAETAQLKAQLQQQLAMMAGPSAWPAPPSPAMMQAQYAQWAAPAAYNATQQWAPPPYQQSVPQPQTAGQYGGQRNRGRNSNRRNNRGRGRGGGGGGAYQPPIPPTVGGIPPVGQTIPPPANQQARRAATPPNPYKRFDNWNYCYSCGYDVDHTSQTCQYRKWGHQEGCTRQNAEAYEQAGHRPSKAGKHKTMLPHQRPGYQAPM